MGISGRRFVALLAACVKKNERRRISFGIGDCGVGGAFVGVGLVLLTLHVAILGGIMINVVSKWGCVQGVWVQCRCWSLGMGGRVSNVGCWDYKSCSSKL